MIERERGTVKFEIIEHIGVLNTSPTGWNKEINVVKWNDKPEKYDIRDWSPGHERMSRGVTLYGDALPRTLRSVLCSCFFILAAHNDCQHESDHKSYQ